MKIAVVDIGSNSIRYMEAEARDGAVFYSPKQVYTTRLAEGLLESGRLSDGAMAHSLDVLGRLGETARSGGLPPYAYATNAVRDAENRDAFCGKVTALLGRRPEVLSGEQEARYAYLAAAGARGGFLEIGGGSTQIVSECFCRSFPLGCVKARDVCPEETLRKVCIGLKPTLDSVFSDIPAFSTSWTAAGGTATTLAALCLGLSAYDPAIVQGALLERDALTACLTRLSDMGDSNRAKLPLLKKRHDVILHGGSMLLYLMDRLQTDALTVSDTDGMEGYALSILQKSAAL